MESHIHELKNYYFMNSLNIIHGMVKEIIHKITLESFSGSEKPLIIGTGGISRLFEEANIFDQIDSDLVLKGLHQSLKLNL